MITIKLRFYGVLHEHFHHREIRVSPGTLAVEVLGAWAPVLRVRVSRALAALNRKFDFPLDVGLVDGDEIAFLGPLAGGITSDKPSVSDAVTVAEVVTVRTGPVLASVVESVAVAEIVSAAPEINLSVSASVTVAESVVIETVVGDLSVSVVDAVAVAEALTVTLVDLVQVADSVSVAESIALVGDPPFPYVFATSDIVGACDQATVPGTAWRTGLPASFATQSRIVGAGTGDLYLCGSAGIVSRLNSSTGSISSAQITTAPLFDMVYVPGKGKIYAVAIAVGQIRIFEIDPTTLASSEVVTDGNGGSGKSITADGTYLYVGTDTNPGEVLRYQLSDFSYQGKITLTGFVGCTGARDDGSKLYIVGPGSSVLPIWVARIDMATFALDDAQNLATAGFGATSEITLTTSYVWIGLEGDFGSGGHPGNVLRVTKSSLATFDEIDLWTGTGLTRSSCLGVWFDATNILAAFRPFTLGLIGVIDPATLTGALVRLGASLPLLNGVNSDTTQVFVTGNATVAPFTGTPLEGHFAAAISLADVDAALSQTPVRVELAGLNKAVSVADSVSVAETVSLQVEVRVPVADSVVVSESVRLAFTVVNLWLETLATGEDNPRDMLYAGGYLWVFTQTTPAKLIRLDPASPSTWTTLTFPADGKHDKGVQVVYAQSKIYLLFASVAPSPPTYTPTHVYVSEVDPSALTFTDVIDDAGFTCTNGAMTTDGSSLYVATYGFPSTSPEYAHVLKYSLSDFSRQADSIVGTNVYDSWAAGWDGSKLYVSGADSPAWFARFTSGLVLEQYQLAPAGDNYAGHRMALDGTYLWSSLEDGGGRVLRVLKSDLSSITEVPTGLAGFMEGVFDGGGYIWAGSSTTDALLARIDPSTLSVRVYRFPPAQSNCQVIQGDASNLYFAYYQAPGLVSASSLASPAGGDAAILVSDLVTLAELTTLAITPLVIVSDSITVSEVVTVSEVSVSTDLVSVTDTVAVAESVALAVALPLSVSDSVNVAEVITESVQVLASVVDAVTVSEVLTVTEIKLPSVVDAVSVAEVVTLTVALPVSVSDPVSVAEAVAENVQVLASVADAVSVAEAITVGIVVIQPQLPSVSDSVTVAEVVTAQVQVPASAAESITVAESAALTVALPLSVTDGITVSEAVSAAVVTSPRFPSVTDAVAVAEVITLAPVRSTLAVSDGITLAESVTLVVPVSLSVSDGITVSESRTLTLVKLPSIADTVNVAEAISLSTGSTLSVADSVVVAEGITLDVAVRLSVADGIAVSETVNAAVITIFTLAFNVAESILVGESLSMALRTLAQEIIVGMARIPNPVEPTLRLNGPRAGISVPTRRPPRS